MKILQVVPYFAWSYGGPVRSVYELSKSLSEMGHDVTIFTTDVCRGHRLPDNEKIELDGVSVRYFKCFNNWIASDMKFHLSSAMRLAIKNELKNFDLVHLHDYRSITHFYIQHYAIKYGVPYILQAHGAAPKTFGNQSVKFTFSKIFFDFFFGQKILDSSSKLIALTDTELHQYLQIGGDPNNIEIVPNGIRLSEYNNLPDKGIFKYRHSIRNDEKIILYLGRIHRIKGIDLLVDSFAETLRELKDCRLVIVGPDDGFLASLKNRVEDLNIVDNVLFIGPLYDKDKLEAYIDAEVYVLPSIYETFPMTVLESCACGTPCIITNCCGIADKISKVGYVIEHNKDQLRDALVDILINKELRDYSGKKSREFVECNFNLPLIVDRIESIYTNVIDKQIPKL